MTIPGDNNITGTYTGDVSRIEVSVDDGEFKKGGTVVSGTFKFYSYGLVTKVTVGTTVYSDGTFKLYILGKITSVTDTVSIAAYDKAGKLLDNKVLTVLPK